MINYTRAKINIIALVISIILVYLINFLFQNIFNNENINVSNSQEIIQEISQENIEKSEELIIDENNWIIEIPVINLKASIANGTEAETMNKYVGHFEETSFIDGNVGLAAHNRGYPVNYFANIQKLKKGDEIYYQYRRFKKSISSKQC